VVGAGLAGLTCAHRLKRSGVIATVYEANTRLGGRCWTRRGDFAQGQLQNMAELWANMNLLFWLSLIPWVTVYLGDNHALPFPVALYAAVSTAGAVSFFLLRGSIARHHHDSEFKRLNKRMARKIPFRL
jgi:glycine/D-amino acid oxidase-like deaminating enzyme